jgi:N-sulfoglucosamine sulfohydrolase
MIRLLIAFVLASMSAIAAESRPNILFCIADDASYASFAANGDPVVRTPTFDRLCREGVRFTHSFCSSPSCTPSRAAILTGRPFFQLEESGNLWSTLRKDKFPVYTDLLEAQGYAIGLHKKGWGPGDPKAGGFTRNPAGPGFKSFAEFRQSVKADQPWCFWFGSVDPHRPYDRGSGAKAGLDPAKVRVPAWLPDEPTVREDIADYLAEIERFDRDVGEIIAQLDARGELDNTLVVVTSDNGMPFPRAKANLYDAGTRMPLVIRWPQKVPGGRVIDDFISHIDLAPTFLEATGTPAPKGLVGRSLIPLLASGKSGIIEANRDRVFIGRERHANARENNLGYPSRAIRTREFLYISNLAPDRWPAGDPREVPQAPQGTYSDIDAGPTKSLMVANADSAKVSRLWPLAFEKRPDEELYDLQKDPDQLVNIATALEFAKQKEELRQALNVWRQATSDPQLSGDIRVFDRYPYLGRKAR